MTIRRMRIACCIPKATNTHSEYVILIAFPRQHWLRELASVLDLYRGADKSLARPRKETSYSNQDSQHYTKTYGTQTTGIYCCCLYAVSLGIVL